MYTRLLFILLLGATWMCSCQTEQSPVNTLADRVTEGTSKDRILFRMIACLLYTSPGPRDKRQSRMPSSA